MGTRLTLLLACVMAIAGCASTPVGTRADLRESFTLTPHGTVASVKSIPFDVRLHGDLVVEAHSEPGAVLVVLQPKKDCGSFADHAYVPSSRYELEDVRFSYYVPEPGDHCLTFQNRNAEPIRVDVTVSFP